VRPVVAPCLLAPRLLAPRPPASARDRRGAPDPAVRRVDRSPETRLVTVRADLAAPAALAVPVFPPLPACPAPREDEDGWRR